MPGLYTPNRDQALWNIMRECAARRINRKCKHRFGSEVCTGCDVYIMNYGRYDPADAHLMMMQAEGSVYEIKGNNNLMRNVLIGIVVFFGLIYLGSWIGVWVERAEKPKDNPPVSIEASLDYVTLMMKARVDVNRDGKVNCIDAAVSFYQHYPDRNNCRIMENRHPDGRMFHLFNAVRVNGKWRCIEPQAYFKNHSQYWMEYVWRNTDQYDHRYCRDATNVYRSYVR